MISTVANQGKCETILYTWASDTPTVTSNLTRLKFNSFDILSSQSKPWKYDISLNSKTPMKTAIGRAWVASELRNKCCSLHEVFVVK